MRSRYPPGYRPGQSHRSARLATTRPRPRSPHGRLAFHRLDARGRRRQTPFAYLLLSLILLTLASGIGLVVMRFSQRLGQAGDGVVETVAGRLPPAVAPIAWTVHLAQAPDGHLYYAADPPAVAERVREDFLQAWRWYYAADRLPDPAQAGQYFTGGYLQAVEYGLGYYAERGHYAYWEVKQFEWLGDVEFSEDGSRATVTARLVGPIEIREMDATQPGTRLQTIRREQWAVTTSLAWDTGLGRWLAYHDVSGEPLIGGRRGGDVLTR